MCKISVSSVPTHRMGIITCLFSRLFWRLKFKNVCKSISRTMPHSWLRNCSLFKLTVRCKGGLIWESSQVMTLNNNNNKQMICYAHTVNFIIKNTNTHTQVFPESSLEKRGHHLNLVSMSQTADTNFFQYLTTNQMINFY